MDSLVSVIIATYRRSKSLTKALSSLTNQTYKNFEIILVDDNDSIEWNNKVSKMVYSFKKKYPSISIEYIQNHPNQGSAFSRNIGINVANGEYVTFLDDDDIYLPMKIEKQVKCIEEAQADFCITDLYLYNEKEILTDKRIRDYIKKTDKRSLLTYHLMYHMTGTDTLMFKKNFLHTIGGFPHIDVGDEFYLVLRAIENNGKLAYLPECDVKAYIHKNNGGLSSGDKKIIGENLLFKKKQSFFKQVDSHAIRFIKMRHYAVLAIAYKNIGKYISAFTNLLRSFLFSPIDFFKMIINHKG